MPAKNARMKPGLSDLSVTEFVTLSRMGWLPQGLVVGCAVYDAGGALASARHLASAMHVARAQAVQRMRDQARRHDGEGVVGVRLSVEHHRWRGGHLLARFLAVGTAVAFHGDQAPHEIADSPSLRLHDGGPFTSDLSGQDFVALLRAGYRPITLAIGNSAVEVSGFSLSTWVLGNVEMADVTQAFFDARETAMDRMDQDLFRDFPPGHADSPCGVVGVTVEEKAHEGIGTTGRVVEFSAIGTAIAPLQYGDPRKAAHLPSPIAVVPLDR
jgi:uncharacterized protein YbjQ (UPF0145 family)